LKMFEDDHDTLLLTKSLSRIKLLKIVHIGILSITVLPIIHVLQLHYL